MARVVVVGDRSWPQVAGVLLQTLGGVVAQGLPAAALPDAKKGEKLVLLLEGEMELDELKEKIKNIEMNPLFVPSEYFKVEELPKLGTGKADFKGAKRLAEKLSDTK